MDIQEIIMIAEAIAGLVGLGILYKENKSLKSIIKNMKKYTDMVNINVDDVKKYSEIKEHNILDRAEKVIDDKVGLNNLIKDAIEDDDIIIKTAYDQVKDELEELMKFALTAIVQVPEKDRSKFLDSLFPKTKRLFIKTLDGSYNKKT